MRTKSLTRCMMLVTALIAGMVLITAGQSFAGVGMAITPSYPSTVAVGQTYDVHLSLNNASTSPESNFTNASCTGNGAPQNCCTGAGTGTCTDTLTIFTTDVSGINGFSHAASCGSVTFPCANPDSVFSLTATAAGGSNTDCVGFSDPFNCCTGAGTGFCNACSGRTFAISAPDANGVVTFSDGNPIVLTAPGTANAGCGVHFSATVLALPTVDASAAPGKQTDQPTFNGAKSGVTNQVVPETGSSIVTVEQPAISLTKSCTATFNEGTQSVDVSFSATLTNTGTETISSITCSDAPATTLSGVPSSLAPGASATITGTYNNGANLSANDTLSCSGSGQVTQAPVSATAPATCSTTTAPAIGLTKSCTATFNGTTQTVDVSFTSTLTNTGNETITAITCSDSPATTLTGVPASLAPGASATITGTYNNGANLSASDTLTCSGSGLVSSTPVSATAPATCSTTVTPTATLTKSCTATFNQGTQNVSVSFTATLTNTGPETINSITCSDSPATTLTGVPSSLAPGASATITGTYNNGANLTANDTLSCSGSGVVSHTTVNPTAPATCSTTTAPAIGLTKSCTATFNGTTVDVSFSSTLTNTGNETITAITCSDSPATTLSGVPSSLAPGATATITGTYNNGTNLSASDTLTCSGSGLVSSTPVSATAPATCSTSVTPKATLTKECTATFNGTTVDVSFSATLTNTGPETLNNITCSDDPATTLTGVPPSLAPGASATITGTYNNGTSTTANDTLSCSGTGAVSGTTVSPTASATCSTPVPTACRMTGGHNNSVSSVDATFVGNGKSYTTGGQIGAPSAVGCCDFPQKGKCVSGSPITADCTTGLCCSGGLNGGMDCTSNDDCPPNTGSAATCPWGDWEHNHHNGPDDIGGIQSGSFAFHSGTAAAPDAAFIHNIICADPGWCVQARPAPDKQIFWEGTGVFHNTTNGSRTNPLPQFLNCPSQPVPWSNKTTGTLSYYRAHVGDFGEPAGTNQKQPPVTPSCNWNDFCAVSSTDPGVAVPIPGTALFGGVSIFDCKLENGSCNFSPARLDQKFTDAHPLCVAQDCGCNEGDPSCDTSGAVPKVGCPDWYEIEIHCGVDPSVLAQQGDATAQFEFLKTQPIAYKVAHFITQGNFQLHPQVGSSCNPSCGNGICEPSVPEATPGTGECFNCADCSGSPLCP